MADSIRGLAAVYYNGTKATEFELFEGARERIMPGAFRRALAGNADVAALFNHDANLILGRTSAGTLELAGSRRGLAYVIDTPNTSAGRDALENVRLRNVAGSSFSFNVTEERWTTKDGQEIREIMDLDLFDVGPVVFPAYKAATAEAGDGDGTPSGRKKARKKVTPKRQLKAIDNRLAEIGLKVRGRPV